MLMVKSFESTVEMIQNSFYGYPICTEKVNIDDAIGRVLAEDIVSKEDVPHFARSTLDGYAIIASDTFGANESIPAMIKLVGEVKMDSKIELGIESGQTIYVPTGGYIPEGANAIAMIEIAEVFSDEILIYKSISPGTGIIFKGDDARAGDIVIKRSQIISVNHIGTFAALGYSSILVLRKLKCGIISTGDELVEIEHPLEENKACIRDVNSHILKIQAEKFGCETINYGICKDNKQELCDIIKKVFLECDIVLVSGGSSVGIMDLTGDAIETATDAEILIHGIAIKPGKPTIIAKSKNKALIGLPGHAVSAFFIMKEIVGKVIFSMVGINEKARPTIKAKLIVNVVSNNGRDDFIPVKLQEIDGIMTACPINYKSGLITLLSKSDGYFRIPRFTEGFDIGREVEVYVF